MTPRTSGRRGMTLVEVMVALVILMVMSGVIFQSLHNSIEFQNLLSERDGIVRTARTAMGKLGHELQLAYLTPNKQAVNTYQTVFVGSDDDPAKLFFASLGHQRLYLDSRECDQTEVTVWAEPAPPERGHGYILYHRESPRIDEYPDEQGVIWPLAYNVRSFRLRYLEQTTGEWKTSWDTRSAETPYRLPRAVEIGLVLIAPDPSDPTGEATIDVPFLTQVILEYAERLPSKDPMAAAALAAAGSGGSSTGTPPQMTPWGGMLSGNLGGLGGMGGMGMQGLSGGGSVGGTLGALPGSKPKGRGAAGRGGAAAGGGVPAGGAGGAPGGGGGGRRR